MFRSRAKSKSRPNLSTRRRFRPRLDVLEVREVLSTLVVTSPADSGPGTLRDRVSAAASGDVITFAPLLIGQTITLTSGPIVDIGKGLAIRGPGADRLAVSGGGTQGIFVFDQAQAAGSPSIDVAVSGLTLEDGNSPGAGAAISAFGANLTLTGDVFRDNASAGPGGAVDAETASPFGPPANSVTIVDSRFLGNTAAFGGAYQSFGLTVTVRGSVFDGNTSTASFAGGLLAGNGPVSVSDSTFRNNVGGGLVHFAGSATDATAVTRSLFVGNTRSSGFGGGLQVVGGVATISASEFRDNATTEPSFAQGGGASITSADSVTVDGSTFVGNRADNPGASRAGRRAVRRGRAGGGRDEFDVPRQSGPRRRGLRGRGDAVDRLRVLHPAALGDLLGRHVRRQHGDLDDPGGLVGQRGRPGPARGHRAGRRGELDLHRQPGRRRGRDGRAGWRGLGRGDLRVPRHQLLRPAGALTVSGSTFAGNSAKGGSGPNGGLSEGGAVYVFTQGSVAFHGGAYLGNSASAGVSSGAGSGGGLAFGGAIRVVFAARR